MAGTLLYMHRMKKKSTKSNEALVTLGMVNSFRSEVMSKFDAVNFRFDSVNHRFDEVHHRFESIDKKFEEVHHRFEAIDKKFEEVHHRIDALEQKMDSRFAEVDAKLSDMSAKINRMLFLMEEQRNDNRAMGEMFIAFEARLDRLENNDL